MSTSTPARIGSDRTDLSSRLSGLKPHNLFCLTKIFSVIRFVWPQAICKLMNWWSGFRKTLYLRKKDNILFLRSSTTREFPFTAHFKNSLILIYATNVINSMTVLMSLINYTLVYNQPWWNSNRLWGHINYCISNLWCVMHCCGLLELERLVDYPVPSYPRNTAAHKAAFTQR